MLPFCCTAFLPAAHLGSHEFSLTMYLVGNLVHHCVVMCSGSLCYQYSDRAWLGKILESYTGWRQAAKQVSVVPVHLKGMCA